VAVPRIVEVVFAGTVTGTERLPAPEVAPTPSGVPLQSAVVYKRTVDPASAVPSTVGVFEVLGETGAVAVSWGADGEIASCTYVTLVVEQGDETPTPVSVAVPRNGVVVFGDTITTMEKTPALDTIPVPAAGPVQSAVLNSRTADPDSAEPLIEGVVEVLLGDAGVVPANNGGLGPALTSRAA